MTLLFFLYMFQSSAEVTQAEPRVWVQQDIAWLTPPAAESPSNKPADDFKMPKLGSTQILICDRSTYFLVSGWVTPDEDGNIVWLEREGFLLLIGHTDGKEVVFTSLLEHPLEERPVPKRVSIKQKLAKAGAHLHLDDMILTAQNTNSALKQSAARLVRFLRAKDLPD